jgi:hypothetical protein
MIFHETLMWVSTEGSQKMVANFLQRHWSPWGETTVDIEGSP